MEFIKQMRVVATSNNKDNFPQCSICGKKEIGMNVTVENKLVCHECKDKHG